MKINIAGSSVKGIRDVQQDSYSFIQYGDKLAVIVVADGNGGKGGEDLSNFLSKAVIVRLSLNFSCGNFEDIDSESRLEELGMKTLRYAAKQVKQYKESMDCWQDAGTTATLILISQQLIGAFWVGDSSGFLFRDNTLLHLTEPVHTLAEMLIEQGRPRDAIEKQPSLNSILTRCVGHDSCEPSSRIVRNKGSCYVIAGSDGVFGNITESCLINILQSRFSGCSDVQEMTGQIIQSSLDNGSDDNCTLVTALVLDYPRLSVQSTRITRIWD